MNIFASGIKKSIIFILFFGISFLNFCFAQTPTASSIEKSQEILEKEKALRARIEKEEKVFIKKIIVSGVTLVNKEEIKEAILPHENHWLTKKEILAILDSISAVYKKNGYEVRISYVIIKKSLKIKVEELTP